MGEEIKLYKITQNGGYTILTTGGLLDVTIDGSNKECDPRLSCIFYELIFEVDERRNKGDYKDYNEIRKYYYSSSDMPEKFLADGFIEWVRKRHPEIGEFEAEYIGPDVSWWYKELEAEAAAKKIPENVKITEDGHWIDKKTGENLDWLKPIKIMY